MSRLRLALMLMKTGFLVVVSATLFWAGIVTVGFGATGGRATLATGAATATMFSPQWNMARVVARGGVVSNERISVKMSRNAMRVIIK